MKLFPDYLPDPRTETRLEPAVLVGTRVIGNGWAEDGASWESLLAIVIERRLCLFTPALTDIARFPYLSTAREDARTDIREGGEHISIIVRDGKRRYHIVPVSQWGKECCDEAFLSFISEVFRYCGHVKPTPPSLGKRTLLESWRLHNEYYAMRQVPDTDWPAEWIPNDYKEPKRRHALPPKAAREAIKDNLHGGRIEAFSDILPGYYKLDQDNALVSHFGRLPTGTALRHMGGHEPRGITCFCLCVVRIPLTLPLGPFPVRTPIYHWPREPGVYRSWLWKEQMEDARAIGCTVTVQEGWYWNRWTTDTSAWIRWLTELRKSAPNEEVRKALKRIGAATVSCMGIGDVRYSHVSMAEYNKETDERLYDSRGPLNSSLRSTRDSARPTPVHWYAYTWMQVARTLYTMALPHAQANALVALHTDALWSKYRPADVEGWKLEQLL